MSKENVSKENVSKENVSKEIMLSKDGLLIKKDETGITVEYNGNLTLTFTGSINLNVNGEVNLLGNGPINIDAPKTDETNYPISFNSRLNTNIKDLPSSIAFREASELKTKKAFDQVNTLLLKDDLSIDEMIKTSEENTFKTVKPYKGNN